MHTLLQSSLGSYPSGLIGKLIPLWKQMLRPQHLCALPPLGALCCAPSPLSCGMDGPERKGTPRWCSRLPLLFPCKDVLPGSLAQA